ncbi:MAG TPA: DMT family transporter [Solirubrobacteraceae bacterium]|nr:DMT family transporter [Solirubrobacteraceae bacterium]
MRTQRPPVPWQLQFVLLSAIWGSSFLFIKVLGERWPPLWVALGRVTLGALTLLVITRAGRARLSRDPRLWLHCAVVAVFFNAAPFTLFAYGEQHTSSIVAGLWNATTPLWVLVISLIAFGEERPTASRVGGLAVGFAGVVLLLGPWRGLAGGALTGQLACAGAGLCYGLGFPYMRRFLSWRPESGAALSAMQLVSATAMLALFIPLSRGPSLALSWQALASLLALGVLGSGVAYALNFAIVRARGAAVASTVTYLIPVFATILGVVVLGEPLRWNQPAGTALLLTGIAVSQGRLHTRSLTAAVRRRRLSQVG